VARIDRIGIKQTTKFVSIYYFVIALIFFLPMMLVMLISGSLLNQPSANTPGLFFGGFFMLFIPFIYAVLGGVMVAIFSFAYNKIARRVGGIEIFLDKGSLADNTVNTQKSPPSPDIKKF
jgi:hypothetical protein